MTNAIHDLPLTNRTYRETMGLFATGVTVLGAESNDEIRGMTANALTSVSLNPLLMLVCINKSALVMAFIEQTNHFSINILSQDQADLSQYFANMWPAETPPPAFTFSPWINHAPYLEDCLGALACRTYDIVDGGDHWVVIGQVIALRRVERPAQPLIYYQGQYRQLR